jgi:cytochrome c oxidase subunit IV
MKRKEYLRVKEHLLVYGFLIMLLAAAVGVSFLGSGGIFFILGTAVVQALLVLIFFMRLRSGNRLAWIFAGASVVWLGMLFSLALSDYLTRGANWLR